MQQISLFRKSLKLRLLFTCFLICTVLCIGLFLYIDSLFRVKTILIDGISKDNILFGLDNLKNNRMFFVSAKSIEDDIIKNNPSVAGISVRKIYPQTITISVTLLKPLAYLKSDSGYFALSPKGRILSKLKEKGDNGIPVINYYQKINFISYQPGDDIGLKDIIMALRFLKKTEDQGLKVITIDIDGVDMIGLNLNDRLVIFSSEKDEVSQIYQLEQIVHQFRIQGKDFKKLDLRFNRPILELIE